eukprot:Tamp_09121.p1 GENE.Tamp_09121~~Tamp_09121.p1  ORF type:complete len:311 (+),score=74.40 Tamp_09121:89-1021(+)
MAENPEQAEDEPPGFWTISSFRVQVRGDTAAASDPFKVLEEKAGDDERGGDASAPKDAAGDANGATRILEFDDQPFPWEMATAVSEKVFEEGVHEFLVEVRGTGLLGFCQASFTEQRANIGKHWMNEDNRNRTWVLHSNGYFANGNQLSANERLARFTSGDRILIRLNLFKETAEYFRDSGASSGAGEPRYMGMTTGICIPVRLGFQMFRADDAITLLKYSDLTDEMPLSERAEGYLTRAHLMFSRADNTIADSMPAAAERARIFGDALRTLDEAARAYSALQDSAKTNEAMEKWNEAKNLKKEAEALKF